MCVKFHVKALISIISLHTMTFNARLIVQGFIGLRLTVLFYECLIINITT